MGSNSRTQYLGITLSLLYSLWLPALFVKLIDYFHGSAFIIGVLLISGCYSSATMIRQKVSLFDTHGTDTVMYYTPEQ